MKCQIFKLFEIVIIIVALLSIACTRNNGIKNSFPESFILTIKNNLDLARQDALVQIDLEKIKEKDEKFNPQAMVVLSGQRKLSSQYIIGEKESIAFLVDMKPNKVKTIQMRYAKSGRKTNEYPKRTHAILSQKVGGSWDHENHVYRGGHFMDTIRTIVPAVHTDHSTYYRFEGPGWESDKVGYRLYLDHRNAIDVFGKKTTDMVLDSIGWINFEHYHEMDHWGMDVLKVGDSFGLGAVGIWTEDKAYKVGKVSQIMCTIMEDGPIYSKIAVDYNKWTVNNDKYDLYSEFSIQAGSRLSKHAVNISEHKDPLCISLIRHDDTEFIKSKNKGAWQYIATFGSQDITGKKLGVVVFYNADVINEIRPLDLDYYLIMKPEINSAHWFFGAVWEEEKNGIKTLKDFCDYLDKTQQKLNNPLVVEFTD
ncbi:DUF4861 domain-containing protein [candidate division KSB1 bacterium]|nr:DUF4861 domain-containing protein [candidate division KSB1 bacterium]